MLLHNRGPITSALSEETLRHFEALFEAINATLR